MLIFGLFQRFYFEVPKDPLLPRYLSKASYREKSVIKNFLAKDSFVRIIFYLELYRHIIKIRTYKTSV